MAIYVQRQVNDKWVDWAGPHADQEDAAESLTFWREMYPDEPDQFRMTIRRRSPNPEKDAWE